MLPQPPQYVVLQKAPPTYMGWWPININDDGLVLGATLNVYSSTPEQVVIWDSVRGTVPTILLKTDPCWAFDINIQRKFVGAIDSYIGPGPPPKAFWGTDDNNINNLAGVAGVPSYAKAINASGVIAGNAGGSLLSGDDFSPR